MIRAGKVGLLQESLRQNFGLYLTCVVALTLGIVLGVYGAQALSPAQGSYLGGYLDSFLAQVQGLQVDAAAEARRYILANLVVIGLTWFLGLTVAGLPLILLVDLAQGFVIGFTVGFLVLHQATKGIAMAALAILPHNLLAVPALLVGSVLAMGFSLSLLRRRLPGRYSLPKAVATYSGVMLAVALVAVGAGLVQAYISPLGLVLVAGR